MKVLSLIQPWASLVALGEKKIETRSWRTKYRGELYIHASASIPKYAKDFCQGVSKILGTKHEGSVWYLQRGVGDLGVIIAKCNLVDCLQITENEPTRNRAYIEGYGYTGFNEYHFGDYTPGRYAWFLEGVEQIEPIFAKGKLGIWEWNGDKLQKGAEPDE